MKKFLLAAIFGLTIIFASAQAEAEEIFVGTSPATGCNCYVLTETIRHMNEHRMVITAVTLKTVDDKGGVHCIDYKFFALDGGFDDVHFSNSEGFSEQATAQDTPIEWATYMAIRHY